MLIPLPCYIRSLDIDKEVGDACEDEFGAIIEQNDEDGSRHLLHNLVLHLKIVYTFWKVCGLCNQ